MSKSLIFPTFLVCFPEMNNNNACSLCKKKLTTACDQHRSIQFLLLTYSIYFSYAISLTDYKKFLKIARKVGNIRLFDICFHFAGYRSSTQEFSAGLSEYLPHLHSLCKIVLKPSNVIPLFQSLRVSLAGFGYSFLVHGFNFLVYSGW
jgi:hypothetical protein